VSAQFANRLMLVVNITWFPSEVKR